MTDVMRRYEIRMEWALLASALLHAAVVGGWQSRQALTHKPGKISPSVREEPVVPTITFVDVAEPEPTPVPVLSKKPHTFLETGPSQVTGEQPKEAELYSDKPTVAANPVNPTGKESDTPFLEGTGTKVLSTEDVPWSRSPPSAPSPSPLPPPQVEEPPQPIAESGLEKAEEKKLALLTPAETPVTPPSEGGGESGREIAGMKSKLSASGAFRTGVAAFNVAASPFGAYDQKVVKAVQSRWYALIEQYGIYERAGTVSVHFQLFDDGSARQFRVTENTAGEILSLFCERAVLDSAPFDPLPDSLRVLVGKEPREVDFTFYY